MFFAAGFRGSRSIFFFCWGVLWQRRAPSSWTATYVLGAKKDNRVFFPPFFFSLTLFLFCNACQDSFFFSLQCWRSLVSKKSVPCFPAIFPAPGDGTAPFSAGGPGGGFFFSLGGSDLCFSFRAKTPFLEKCVFSFFFFFVLLGLFFLWFYAFVLKNAFFPFGPWALPELVPLFFPSPPRRISAV